ncbi:ankyrin repeat domain-containing protein [Chitinophaga sp. GCM10012297]|uniref:Ankyrin repeat domain-containing protein n=1 Tax=Chitinophaga chungangae TaxID=2821488 RepID=A0ABS3YKJ9_9BACT|nr:ankyrin repeat domain-containing protein [Chitinophaga chungangae]MBO9155222.1 ankyrin repeat domain-containing protein [Chitinophaga chungangae]
MTRPEALSKNEPLIWSHGNGIDVWNMFQAAATGDVVALRTLLSRDPGLIKCEYEYRTPMYFAVKENQAEAVKFLLEQGANPVSSGTSDILSLMAKDRGFTEIQTLLEKATGQLVHPEGNNMAKAIRDRNIGQVKKMLDANPQLLHAPDEATNQPVHWAVMTRQPELIEELLRRGADINAQRYDGARPIQLCNGDYSYRGWRDVPADGTATPKDIYELLVKHGANIDIYMASLTGNIERVRQLLDEDPTLANRLSDYVSYYQGSGSALNNAVSGGHREVVKLLLERGADPNLSEPGIAPMGHSIYTAVVREDIETVKLLLQYGAHANVEVESSADALSRAIRNKNQPIIDLLCSYGAYRKVHLLAYYNDLLTAAAMFAANPALANDTNALENAAGQGNELFVKLMLHYQPDLAKRISVGVSIKGPEERIQTKALRNLLFSYGMNPNLRSWLGITPLHKFAGHNDLENAESFVEHGADINAVDEENCTTPLGYAAKHGRKEMAEWLLKKGADPSLPHDRPWAQPLAWAERRGHTEIVELLKTYPKKQA